MTNILPADLVLGHGSHPNPDAGMCVMEAVAYVAGEPHSGSPACASPVLAALLRRWNDDLPHADRTRLLLPLVPVLVGSRGAPEIEAARAWRILDWQIRVYQSAWLRLAGITDHADAMAALSPQIDEGALATSAKARAAAGAAWDAAGAAAGDALAPTVAALQQSAADLIRELATMEAP